MQSHEDDLYSQRPLLIGCSGGNGHNSAITAIAGQIRERKAEEKDETDLDLYTPVRHSPQRIKNHPQYRKIMQGINLTYLGWLSWFSRQVLPKTPLPLLPTPKEMKEEIRQLGEANKHPRPYIDMLLDVHPAGFEGAAIWNVLQKNEQTQELKKLITFRDYSDNSNYPEVKEYFIALLWEAAENGRPYAEIISTQAVGIGALCDAVIDYNMTGRHYFQAFQPIRIRQYLTDIPSKGCIHFRDTLQKLTLYQRAQMSIWGIHLTEEIVRQMGLNHPPFFKTTCIQPAENPMVRSGFREMAEDNAKWTGNTTLSVQTEGKEDKNYLITADEKMASIMLGSQAGLDTAQYVIQILPKYDKIMVFAGRNRELKKRLQSIRNEHPLHQDKIITLDGQDDRHIAPLFIRSNLIIIRGGGLSVMEMLAIKHASGKIILIHSQETSSGVLTSGIAWEDENTAFLIRTLEKEKILAKHTTTKHIRTDLRILAENATPAGVRAAEILSVLGAKLTGKTYRIGLFGGSRTIVGYTGDTPVEKYLPRHAAMILPVLIMVSQLTMSGPAALEKIHEILDNIPVSYWRNAATAAFYNELKTLTRDYFRDQESVEADYHVVYSAHSFI